MLGGQSLLLSRADQPTSTLHWFNDADTPGGVDRQFSHCYIPAMPIPFTLRLIA